MLATNLFLLSPSHIHRKAEAILTICGFFCWKGTLEKRQNVILANVICCQHVNLLYPQLWADLKTTRSIFFLFVLSLLLADQTQAIISKNIPPTRAIQFQQG